MLMWLADIIQNPQKKSGVAPVIRDQDGLENIGGGTGKNLLIEWIGNEIIGQEYFQTVGNNSELYSSFNSLFEGKLLIFVEEANGKDNHSNNDSLKSQITQKKRNVNKKQVAQYTVNDYSRYIFSTNNRNPLKFNRRFAFFDVNPCKQGDVKYFNELSETLSDDAVKWAFFQYLKRLKTYKTPLEFENNIPKNETYRETKVMNAPPYHRWLIDRLRNHSLSTEYVQTSTLYADFEEWAANQRRPGYVMSMTEFGKLLGNATSLIEEGDSGYELSKDVGTKRKSHGVMVMRWNIDALVQNMKNLYLLEDDFQYDANKCQLEKGRCYIQN
jgi:hypothetical protein